jgi:hypothetical protein
VAFDKSKGRLAHDYRITWVDDGGPGISGVNPPISPERVRHWSVGRLAGTQVDALVCTVGPVAGYTTSYPTQVEGMEFVVDRLEAGALIGGAQVWRNTENLRSLWADGHDALQLVRDEAKRVGIDFWLQLRMNDWHHIDDSGQAMRLMSSQWYEQHPEYLIGEDGVAGWPEQLGSSLRWFQDFAHEPVRKLRYEVAAEAVERYDVDGWEYDFVRCPGLFRYGQEREHAPLITALIRDTRTMLDEVGRKRGHPLGLAVRVPNTIEGSTMLGLDVVEWIEEGLVDIVVPCSFFAQDTAEDATEWVQAAANTPVRIHFGMDEGYQTGAVLGLGAPYFQVRDPLMQVLTPEMVRGMAARHWRAGVEGIYLFNGPGSLITYGVDRRRELDQIGSALRIQYMDKRYAVMRRTGSFPNCYPQQHLLPADLGATPTVFTIDVADDLAAAGARLRQVHLELLLAELTHLDELEVTVNGKAVPCLNPLESGKPAPDFKSWLVYDLADASLEQGKNEVAVLARRLPRLAEECALVLSDVELSVGYRYPNGPYRPPPGYRPRT